MKQLNIIYEDNHIIAVKKESGVLSQGDITGEDSLIQIIKKYIKEKYNKPGNVFLGLVHRIDKPVSGTIIYAKTSKAAARLQKEFLSKRVNKFYIAIVHEMKNCEKKWQSLEHNIEKRRAYSIIVPQKTDTSKTAELQYLPLLTSNGYSLLLIKLLTGRKHQIRVQMSYIGNPIIGDKKYKSDISLPDESICLHSFFINIKHPVKDETLELISEIPERFLKIMNLNDDTSQIILKEINDHIKT